MYGQGGRGTAGYGGTTTDFSGVLRNDGGAVGQAATAAGIISGAPTPTLTQLNSSTEPFLEIVEQPKARGLRFRYKCEGRSAGAILGEATTNENRTYPMIQIHNFSGPSAIIVVSCVTKDEPAKPHPHSLVGKDCKEGVCTVKLKGATTLSFPNLGIQCSTKREIMESLKNREKIRVDPFGVGYYNNTSSIDLNVVRLAFQCFLPDKHGKYTRIVPPVVSQAIYDKKAVNDLVICRLSSQAGRAKGGDEVFMLTEKVNKDDIQIRFFEESSDGVCWSQFADFGQQDVHRQFAIVFRTPPYKDTNIMEPRQVFLQLTRPSDGEVSDAKPFQYTPDDPDPDGIERKRKRKILNYSSLMTDMPTEPAFPPQNIPTTIDDTMDFNDDTKTVVKQRLKMKAQRNNNKRANAMNSSQAAATPVSQPGTSTAAMDMFRQITEGAPPPPPPASSTAQQMFQTITAGVGGAAGGGGAQQHPHHHHLQQPGGEIDLNMQQFLTDNGSLNLPSMASFPVTEQELQAGGDAMHGSVAAVEEIQEEVITLPETLSINTTRKITEAIEAINNLNE